MKDLYFEVTAKEKPAQDGFGPNDAVFCVKATVDVRTDLDALADWLWNYLIIADSKYRLTITDVKLMTEEDALDTFGNGIRNLPVYTGIRAKAVKRAPNPLLTDGHVKGIGGTFEVSPSHSEDYPGVDIVFHVKGNHDLLDPRILFEQEDGALRVLIWDDPRAEEYTTEFVFDLSKWRKEKGKGE